MNKMFKFVLYKCTENECMYLWYACHILVYAIISMNFCQYPPLLWRYIKQRAWEFKVLMKRNLSLSYLKEHLKRQSNIFCSFLASFLRYFCLFDMQIKHIYVTVCHIVHNELSEKAIYLCYWQTKSLENIRLVWWEKHRHIIRFN